MINRLLRLPLENNNSFFLFGPRGTGKTQWIKTHLPDSPYFDLLDFETYSMLSTNPTILESKIPQNDRKKIIVIDEVQMVPYLLNEVHRLIEQHKFRFLLTGSSARSLRKKGVNLLAGRAHIYYMHPLVIQEIGADFSLSHALEFGLLPVAVTRSNPSDYLKSYAQIYVQQEVGQEGLTRKIGSFSRFLEVASFSQGSLLNYSEIGREIMVERRVVANYFDILEDLLLAIRIRPFTKRAKRKLIAHEKFYFFDVGVYKFLRPKGFLDTDAEADGAGLETLFLQSVRAINDYFKLDYKIFFWRTATDTEVDFVLYGPHGFHAFEIKRSRVVNLQALKGLKAFGQDYPEAKLHYLYLGTHMQYHDTITARPFEKALKELPELLGYNPGT